MRIQEPDGRDMVVIVGLSIFLLLLLYSLACGSQPRRFYNLNDTQDPDCYKNSAARPGYCDK